MSSSDSGSELLCEDKDVIRWRTCSHWLLTMAWTIYNRMEFGLNQSLAKYQVVSYFNHYFWVFIVSEYL